MRCRRSGWQGRRHSGAGRIIVGILRVGVRICVVSVGVSVIGVGIGVGVLAVSVGVGIIGVGVGVVRAVSVLRNQRRVVSRGRG